MTALTMRMMPVITNLIPGGVSPRGLLSGSWGPAVNRKWGTK